MASDRMFVKPIHGIVDLLDPKGLVKCAEEGCTRKIPRGNNHVYCFHHRIKTCSVCGIQYVPGKGRYNGMCSICTDERGYNKYSFHIDQITDSGDF